MTLAESHSKISLVTVSGVFGQQLMKPFQEDLETYFSRLINDAPLEDLIAGYGVIYNSTHSKLQESTQLVTFESMFTAILNDWTARNTSVLDDVLRANMERILEAGYRLQAVEFAESLGIPHNLGNPIDVAGLIRAETVSNVSERVSMISSQMDATTLNATLNTIHLASLADKTPQQMLLDIKKLYRESFEERRALVTAQFETNNMLSLGAFSLASDAGSQEKRWDTVGDARVDPVVCLSNEAQGTIKIHEAFQSGHPHPSGHIRCRCTAIYSEPTQALLGLLGY